MSKRTYTVNASITKDNKTVEYVVKRQVPMVPGVVKEYTFAKSDKSKIYNLTQDCSGCISCNCDGFNYHATCKHVDFAIHFGLFDMDLVDQLRDAVETARILRDQNLLLVTKQPRQTKRQKQVA